VQQPRVRGVQDARAVDQAQGGGRERRVSVWIASGHSTSAEAKSGPNGRSTFSHKSQLTLCGLCAPDAWGTPGAEYYFCCCVVELENAEDLVQAWWTDNRPGEEFPAVLSGYITFGVTSTKNGYAQYAEVTGGGFGIRGTQFGH